MISGMNRRDILERVRTGELAVADAVALMRADGHNGEVVAYRAGWQRAEPAAAPPLSPGPRPLVVLDPSAADRPGLAEAAGVRVVRATTGRTDPSDASALRVGDDASWERLWERLDADGEAPQQVVVVTAEGPERCLDAMYPVVRTLIRRPGRSPVAIACVAVGERGVESADALGGFCSIAALEDGRLRPVAVSAVGLAAPVEAALRELALPAPPLHQVRVHADGRWVRTLTATELAPDTAPDALGGVHLVSGGGGGIALRLAEELAVGAGARLVLLGRSAPGTGVDDLVRRVRDAGSGGVRYVQGDATRLDDVRRAVAEAHTAFGPVTDVLHLAGVNEDAYIANKTPGAHARVLAPKLAGARALDEATRDEPLRHFALFSSLAGYAGHPGQADYAAAGRALGGFAVRRAELVATGRRRGRTVSVGWPLWADGGMTLSDTDRRAVEALQGMVGMPPRTGLSVLAAALRADAPEIVVVHGHRARIEKFVQDRLAPPAGSPAGVRADEAVDRPSGPVSGALTATARDLLLGEVSRLTRMKPGRLRPDQEFSALGIDSVMVKRLGTALEDRLGPMPATLLFDHRTVDDLAAYLVSHHREALAASSLASAPTPSADPDPAPASYTRTSGTPRSEPAGEGTREVGRAPDDAIAVIGIAGRYPGARDVDELWQMLVEGRDAITEIPAERWDKARWTDRGERLPGTSYGRWGGFLDDMSRFDSLFFSVAPREARRMDPAERLFLEVAWTALEDAGYTRDRLHRATRTDDGHAVGVFAGTTGLAYGLVGAEEWGKGNPVPAYSMEFSLANRLSWFLDVHGPSLAVDTACSASLTALHLACESLRHGECRMAVAGGAYLNLHPMKFGMLAEQRMMSPDGVCRAFGEGGNGLVPGEGVGAVVLKPLAAARADGDRVDAVIRATAISHGGRTNGYTVPSPKAHAAVIGSALRRSGVDAGTISCVEAHGTGTELGDPIEIEGLARAFGRSAERRAPVALGSLKPNIGHAEAAAGIAGLTKLVLQLRHRTLVPTLHSDPPNSRIDFGATPFRLQRTAEPWHVAGGGPRRAALSSFGAGGANAHAVIEEYPAVRPDTGTGQLPDEERLILLSARTPDRLTATADRLAAFLTAPRSADVTLTDIAHTLRVGREDFECRAAFVVRTREALRTALLSYAATGAATATGRVGAETLPRPAAGPQDPSDLRGSAARWVRGEEAGHTGADRTPSGAGAPRIVSLPAYPFAGPVHWPDTVETPPSVSSPPPDGPPLAERAASGAGSAEYAVTLTPEHPWVADHLVDGAPVLAGTAHLELARAAAQLSTGRPVTELADLRWRVPLVVATDAPSAVRTRRDDGTVHVEIVTGSVDSAVVHATARAVLPDDTTPAIGTPDPVGIESVRARCAREVDGAAFYRGADARGLVYGPSYRRVERLWCGDGLSLAELSPSGPGEQGAGTADPGLTDAALHAVHGAVPDWDEPATRPAAAELVRVHDDRTAPRYAVAELVTADPARGTVVCDVRTTDADGRVLVEITGLTVLRPSVADVPYLVPVWRVEPRSDEETVPAATGPALVLTAGHDAGVAAALARHHGADGTVDIASLDTVGEYRDLLERCSRGTTVYFTGGVDTRRHSATDLDHLQDTQRRGCLALFRLARSLADLRPRDIRLVVLTSDSHPLPGHPVENPFAGSLHGMARTLSRELPFLDVVCVDLGRADLERCAEQGDFSALVVAVAAERKAVPLEEVALREGTRLVKRHTAARLPALTEDLPLRHGGRYLVVGGAGGLGRVVADHLLRAYDARVLLTGRRNEEQLPAGTLDRLRGAGGRLGYLSGDVTDPSDAHAAVGRMHEEYGGVDGVLHTAFVLADRTIAQSDDETFDAAFAPRTRGTVALADALTAEKLDFFALFSSAVAHTGNPGQSNYTAGSSFLTAYGAYLADRLHWPVTVFDWGYWGDEGAVATPEHRERLARWGVRPLSAAEGLRAFRQVLGSGLTQVAPLRADTAELARVTPLHPGDRLRLTDDGADTLRAPVAALDSALRAAGEPYAPDYLDAVDDYARLAVLDALRDAAPALAAGEARDPRELSADLAVRDDRRHLFDALLAALTAGGLVTADDGRYRVTNVLAEPGRRSAVRRRLTDRFRRLGPTLDLVDDCAAALPDVLSGRRRGLEVLFPGGSDHRMAALYADDPRTRHFNDLTATAVRAAVADRVATEPGRRVRILEIGAGTGATTRAVLDALGTQTGLVSYDVTDISPSLVAAARGRLADGRPGMAFRTLDICGDLPGQGFDGDPYDIVVATNVLHATGDIRRTLAHTARLTVVGGLLAVNEATRVLDAVTPVFGLTDGWWLARDPELRLPHGPLLASGTWRALLAEAGFEQCRDFGVHGWSDEQAGQRLFVARRSAWSIPAADSAELTADPLRARSAHVPDQPVPAPEPASPADDLVARTTSHLRDLFADLLGMPSGELDVSAPLASFGTDSLTVMDAVGRLEQEIGTVPRELLATGESVAAVARALTEVRAPELAAALPTSPGIFESDGRVHLSTPGPAPEAAPADPAPTTPLGDGEPIAIVGIAGRYPGAGDLDTLWGHLVAGRRLITREPPGRWQETSPDHPAGEHGWGGFLDDVDRFDPLLFRIAPREAERMDPAERLFLETAWEALEDAALPPVRLRERTTDRGEATGVFVGLMHHQYALLGAEERARGNDVRALSAGWSVANRVSHTFGLTGPSMAVDTACSSALTALHLALRSLRAGECATALVGGVNLILHPSHHADLAAARMLSPGGTPLVFDTAADGIVTGEGVGALVLKRLSDAVRDGDRIHARILGSAVNADGPTDAYAVPRVEAQVELIARALRSAGADARSVQYVEAQATGSPVGDPVELAALRRAYGVRADGHHLRLGSVKPNTGHLEAASGMVQLAKVVLQLRHRTLVPTEGTDGPLTADGFEVPREPVPWPAQASGAPRRAAVSSFGAGGANAHVIVEEEPAATAPESDGTNPPRALLLSARRPEILRSHAGRLAAFLRGPGASLNPRDVTHTLRVGREPLPARIGAVVHTLDDIVAVLDACAGARPHALLVETGTGGGREEDGDHPAAVVRRWVEGSDTRADHAPEPGARVVSLPHYPFAAGRYWLRTSGTPADGPAPSVTSGDGSVPAVTAADRSAPSASSASSVPESPATGVRPSEEPSVPRTHSVPGDDSRPSAVVTMRRTVTEAICDLLGVAPSDIDPGDHLSDFGLDSVTMVQLADRLATVTGTDLTPQVLYGCRDLAALVDHLVAATHGPAGDNPPSSAAPEPAPGPAPSPAPRPEPVTESEPVPAPSAAGAVEEPVAVVGMAGAFPGSPDLDTFWDNLVQGRDLISQAPADRFGADARAFRGGFLDGVDRFDADFFQISPREARVMDPQHRLFLQTVWSAVEDSGHNPLDLAGTTCGVFVGVASSEYGELAQERGADLDGQLMTGNDHSVLANRVSFLLDLRGPSEPVDTACSSSLVAVHRAVRAIQTGECTSAIAGGVNVIVAATGFEAFGRSGMLAPDGRCKSFDHRADGYVRGEGVGAVLLKPLSRALEDGDHIHGVIAGSATNHGGRAASLTAPNPAAQAEVISRAQRRAGARPETIGYVEAHGTGTALGDPIEVTGLRTAFEPPVGSPMDGTPRQYCGLGSVKTNVGHLETAAGMAGLFKVLLALRHEMLPPTLHVERVNPLIRLADSPFHLVTSARPWFPVVDGATGTPLPRRAGVSSFGFGGTNAHLVVEEAPRPVHAVPRAADGGDHLFVLSARDEDRLDAAARGLLDRIDRWERDGLLHTVAPADVARTLQTGRRHFAARLAVVAPSLGRVAEALRARVDGDGPRPARGGQDGGRSRYDDGDVREALRRAADGDLTRLATVWEAGTDVDFAILWAGAAGTRVPLPTYPFAPDRYWLPDAPAPATAAPAVPIASATARPPHTPPPPPSATASHPAPAPSTPAPLAAQPLDAASALRSHVRAAVADGVGIAARDVDPTRDFASYGVDSIGAMRIMQTIQNRYGDHIPMAAILEHPSVDRLVTHLERDFVLPDEVPTGLDRRNGVSRSAPAQLPAPPVAPRPRLVPFTADGPGTPVYCVFGDTGELTWLMHLVGQLGKDGPVIGVEAPGFRDGATPVADVDVLADLCAEAVVAAHQGGSCRIAGQGLAGYVAAQTARLLHDRGLPVEELLLIGTPAPGEQPRNETRTASLAEVAATLAGVWGAGRPANAADPAGGPEDEGLARVCAALAAHAPLDTEALSARLERGARWRAALVTAAASHRLPPIGGPERTTVVRAAAPGGAPGDYHRWIAPPPEIVDIDVEPWRLLSAGHAGRMVGRTPARPTAPGSPAASPVVAINRHGDSRRSIWAHNLYGEVSYAIYLSRHLGPHTPVIGLEQIGAAAADGEPRRYDSVEDMAAHYVEELRNRFPGEPYLLGGCSFGGVLAYEMARQLQLAGEEVSHLIAIDPIMPGTEAWDSVDWGTVTEMEAEAFSLVMLGNAMCQRWGVGEQIRLDSLTGLDLAAQLDLVARHIRDRSAARPDQKMIERQILVRHELMLHNGDLLQAYRPEPLRSAVPTTLFHATEGFLAPGNSNDLPAVPRTSADRSNGLAEFVGPHLTIHEMRADHHTIAHDENLARIAGMLSPVLNTPTFPSSLFPASLSPAGPEATR
ncbi:SDR family NAD(P)-dependent oxidoreductase [Streptomyces sp. NPDC050428]|uniref:SDR family NAD(P)-dependent oxidoreductase n=1 Tax=Streptomyces sp. NPDC050428 TaxID=3155757 RepID=UPI00342C3D11